jgi:6-phosphogluconolactonase
MLTGGRAAKEIYNSISKFNLLYNLENIDFYLSDERLVDINDKNSNYKMIKETLFKYGLPKKCNLYPMIDLKYNIDIAAKMYSDILPIDIDILLLSMGEDGHIASLFPNSAAISETTKSILPVIGTKLPYQRITITPKVIKEAKNTFVFSMGEEKISVFNKLLDNMNDIYSLPARLVIHAEWFLIK